MRFVARNAWVYVLAKNVTILACADAQGRGSVRPLAENQELPATSNSHSAGQARGIQRTEPYRRLASSNGFVAVGK